MTNKANTLKTNLNLFTCTIFCAAFLFQATNAMQKEKESNSKDATQHIMCFVSLEKKKYTKTIPPHIGRISVEGENRLGEKENNNKKN